MVSFSRMMGGSHAWVRPMQVGFSTGVSRTDRVDRVVIPREELRSSYQTLFGRFTDLTHRFGIAACGTPLISGLWCFATEQSLVQSPVALATSLVGVWVATDATLQILRTRKMIRLGVRCDQEGPSVDERTNRAVLAILKGGAPLVQVRNRRMIVSGPTEREIDPIPSRETIQRILALRQIKLPEIVLSEPAAKHAELIHHRWMVRFTVPFSVFNIMMIGMKIFNPNQKLRADDYVALAASFKNLHDFFVNSGLHEEVKMFSRYMKAAKTPEEVVRLLIEKDLFQGPLGFMKYWTEDLDRVSIRVDRLGGLRLYQDRKGSFLGPMPIKQFPKRSPNAVSFPTS